MTSESKPSNGRGSSLTGNSAISITLALLLGAGIIGFYTEVGSIRHDLSPRMATIEARMVSMDTNLSRYLEENGKRPTTEHVESMIEAVKSEFRGEIKRLESELRRVEQSKK